MTAAVKFQALPPLSPEEYAALEKSILDHGVMVPILVDEDNVVIDGHHRQKICQRHDLPCPREVKTGFTDTEKRTLALSLNLDRRHLTRAQRQALVVESLSADPQLSNREHGRRTGVDHKTVGAARNKLESTGEIPQSDRRVSGDGRSRPSSPAPRPEPYFTDEQEAADCFAMAELTDDGFDAVLAQARAQDDLSRENVTQLCRDQTSGQKPRRKPITHEARSLSLDLGRIHKRLVKLVNDDRFGSHREEIGCAIRPQVAHVLEALARIDRDINGGDAQ